MQQDKRWQRLEAFEVGEPGAALGFVDRLARENGWSKTFAAAVFLEYKKFVYLIASSGRELTPSDEVDQAWHLHLVYTRSYWRDLCDGILGFPLHHQPTRGGEMQQSHFKHTYQHTLDCYAQIFGTPPADIWPNVDERFHDVAGFVRVNGDRSWIIRKPAFPLCTAGLGLSIPMLLTACGPEPGESPFWFWVKVAVGVWGIYMLWRVYDKFFGGVRGRKGSDGGGCGGGGCSGCGGCGGG